MTNEVKILLSAQDAGASRVLDSVRASMERVSKTAGVLTGALSLIGVSSIGGLALMARSVNDGVDKLNDLKDATGASIENISALEDIAARTGTSFDTLGTSLLKFNATLKDAKPGSDAARVFEALGLSVKELQALDPAEALLKVATAFAGFADDGNKARVAQELFGKSLRDIAPLLKDLAEKGKLVGTVTTEQADEAERFGKALSEMGKNALDAARYLTGDLVKAINATAKAYKESGFQEAIKTLVRGDEDSRKTKAADNLKKQIEQYERQLKLLKDKELTQRGGLNDHEKQQKTQLEAEIKRLAGVNEAITAERQSSKPLPTRPGQSTILPSLPALGDDTKKTGTSAPGLSDAEKEEQRFQRDLLEAKRQVAIDAGKAVEDYNEKYQQSIKDQTAARDQYRSVLQRELEDQAASNASMAQQVEEIGLTTKQLNALRLARLDATIAQQAKTVAIMEANGFANEEIDLMQRRLNLLREQRALTAKGQVANASAETRAEQERASKDYAATLKSDLKGALSAAFRDTKDPIAAFGDALANTVFTRVSSALAEAAVTGLLGSGSSGSSPGFLASLFSFEGGGSTGNGARSGGLDGRGGFLSILHPQETVTDHTRTTTPSSAAPIINIIEAPGKGGQVNQRSQGGASVIDIMVEQIKGAIAQDINSGNGSVPRAMASTYGLNRVAGAY